MREHPWHLRRPGAKNQLWFQNLVDVHELTARWISCACKHDPLPALLLPQELRALENREMSTLFDETLPDDCLGRLERKIWLRQAATLKAVQQNHSDSLQLETLSTQHGAEWAQQTWTNARMHEASTERLKRDLRGLRLTLQQSPLQCCMTASATMEIPQQGLRRALPQELIIELPHCPHQSPLKPVLEVADLMCELHRHWHLGMARFFNPSIHVEHRKDHHNNRRQCVQTWTFNA